MNFKTLDDKWFMLLFNQLEIDETNVSNPKLHEYIEINLTSYAYISFYNLVRFCLTLEYLQSFSKNITIAFYGIGPSAEDQILKIDTYNEIRLQKLTDLQNKIYQISDTVYSFLAYLNYFGFFSALNFSRSRGKITIPGIGKDFLSKLYKYQGLGDWILPIVPINSFIEAKQFRLDKTIEIWLLSIDEKYRKHPLLREKEFARVYGFQLTHNIIEHGLGSKEDGLKGALNMQLITKEKYHIFYNQYPSYAQSLFKNTNDAVFEICVGDRGQGLYNTLLKAYDNIQMQMGKKNNKYSKQEVLQFAFDEIGSSKNKEQRIGGVHALHRILKSTAKYGGVIKVISNGIEMLYDFNNSIPERVVDGFGFFANSCKEIGYTTVGVQFHILIPIRLKNLTTQVLPKREYSYIAPNVKPQNFIIIPVSAFYNELTNNSTYDEFIIQRGILNISNKIEEASHNSLIVYDFGEKNWSEEDIAKILLSQKNILHTKCCLGINLPRGLSQNLREREKLKLDETRKKITSDSDFFDVLSSKHRLFPTFDIDNNLYWLGLSDYNIDSVFLRSYFEEANGLTESSLYKELNNIDDLEICKLYLNSNNQLFTKVQRKDGLFWKSIITRSLYNKIVNTSIANNFKELLASLKCILEKEDQFFILPSSKRLTKRFIQSTPFFHNNPISSQIGKRMGNAMIELLKKHETKLLVITATGPSELISTIISENLSNYDISIINIGIHSSNEDSILFNIDDWCAAPIFIVSDVIDKGTSIDNILLRIKSLNKKSKSNLNIRGILSLIHFNESQNEEIKIVCEWQDYIGHGIKTKKLIYAYMQKPLNFDWDERKINEEPQNINVIEPFSLNAVNLAELAVKDDDNESKLQLLANNNLLREGHFIYENHHFSVTTCLKQLFKTNAIKYVILNEIIDFIKAHKINLILIPLHSHIREFVPAILLNIKLTIGVDIEYYYCISSKILTDNHFYTLPKELENRISSGRQRLSILILDDAIATGRTQETLIRALIRAEKLNSQIKIIDHISIYAIIDRLGRAKDTLWRSIDKLKISKTKSLFFHFKRWILLDMQVYYSENCPLCKERESLKNLNHILDKYHNTTLVEEIKERIDSIVPHSTESSFFINSKPRPLSQSIMLDDITINSLELAIWQIYNLTSRGYPFIFIINEIDKFSKQINYTNKDDIDLIIKVGKIAIHRWNNINSVYHTEHLLRFLKYQVEIASTIAKKYLSFIGNVLPNIRNENIKDQMLRIVIEAINNIKKVKSEVQLENLKDGIILFFAFYNQSIHHEKAIDNLDDKKYNDIKELIRKNADTDDLSNTIQAIYRNILYFSEQTSFIDSFIASISFLMAHTLRSRRSNSHSTLFPQKLFKLSKQHLIDKIERSYLLDTISYIIQSFDIVDKTYPSIFSDKHAQLRIVKLKLQLKELNRIITTEDWKDNKPSVGLSNLSKNILAHFPNNSKNAIFICLTEISIPLKTYYNIVKDFCEKNNINLEEEGTKDIDIINVLVPPSPYEKEVIRDCINNYLPSPTIKDPRVKFKLTAKKDDIKILIQTRLKSLDSIESFGFSHGLLEIKRGNNQLFGIGAKVKEVSNNWNTAEFSLNFKNAFKTNIKK